MIALNKQIKGKVRFNEEMSRHTTFRIGGVIDAWMEPADVEDLRRIIKFSKEFKKPIYIIGGGSNLLVSDRRIKGVAIHLSGPSFEYVGVKGNCVIAGAGLSLAALLTFCIKKGLSGLEFCAGLPGTIGGSVVMNAGLGAKDPLSNIGNFVNRITAMDRRGRVGIIERKDLNFGYRTSSIKRLIILEAELGLRKSKRDYVDRRCKLSIEKKRKTQELSKPSAGCIFKNPYKGFVSAGKLIELAGLKGRRMGEAQISKKNANYIINLGPATFKDVKKLIEAARQRVKEEFNINLDLEIKILE